MSWVTRPLPRHIVSTCPCQAHLAACPLLATTMKTSFERLTQKFNQDARQAFEDEGSVPVLTEGSVLMQNGFKSLLLTKRSPTAMLRQRLNEMIHKIERSINASRFVGGREQMMAQLRGRCARAHACT